MHNIDVTWDNSYIKDCIPNFVGNMEKPRHRWYEFKEGFSSSLVEHAIHEVRISTNKKITVLDPFSGSGTSVLTALQNNCDAIGYEVNPFMNFVGKTKCIKRTCKKEKHLSELEHICSTAPYRKKSSLETVSTFSPLRSEKWLFNLDVLRTFEALKSHIVCSDNKDLYMLALISAIMQCCNAKKDGKCLRYIKDWKQINYTGQQLRELFKSTALKMIDDMETCPLLEGERLLLQGDARQLMKETTSEIADLIVFSPPYLNSFDYSDIYRPELFLCDFIKNNAELMEIRKKTLRSHVQCQWEKKEDSESMWVKSIVRKLRDHQDNLWNKNIPQMVSSYFFDMETVLKETYRIAKEHAKLWFIVSTSAYVGVEIPVDLILASIATKNGWKLESINALRNLRSSSQHVNEKNKKVRLRESLIICTK